MQSASPLEFAAALSFALLAATLLLWALGREPRRSRVRTQDSSSSEEDSIFLYVEDRLADATAAARSLFEGDADVPRRLNDFVDIFRLAHPGLPSAIESLPDTRRCSVRSHDKRSEMQLSWEDGAVRIRLQRSIDAAEETGAIADTQLDELKNELDTHRAIARNIAMPIWRRDEDHNITWANEAYLELARAKDGKGGVAVWPPKQVFQDYDFPISQDRFDQVSCRASISVPGELEPRWFECRAFPMASGMLFSAQPIRSIVRAEKALNQFVQTMTATFAHLSVGLAIFDKTRKLVVFNPALGDLTTLKPEYLTSRPSLQAFLEKLRDKRLIPEPRDYKSWRQVVQEFELRAQTGDLSENWTLPGGQVYRVTGRPHPEGAIAIIIEDISAEMTLSRRFRSEIESRQAFLDTQTEALAVFDAAGTLAFTNSKYDEVWGISEDDKLDHTVAAASSLWAEVSQPTPVWGDFRDFISTHSDRSEWNCAVQLKDGRVLFARFGPLQGNMTFAAFSLPEAQQDGSQTSQDATADLGHPVTA